MAMRTAKQQRKFETEYLDAKAREYMAKKARRHRETGEISGSKPGRPDPAYEYGLLYEDGTFKPKAKGKAKGKRGRPAGSKNKSFTVGNGRKPGRPAGSNKVTLVPPGLRQIEAIVMREVDSRLRVARAAALKAFDAALS